MNIRTMCKLQRAGFDEEWLDNVKMNWKPKRIGTYLLKIVYLEDICDDPEQGIFIDNTCFDTENDLFEILKYFEGLCYILSDTATETKLSAGIIDYNLFDEIEWEVL